MIIYEFLNFHKPFLKKTLFLLYYVGIYELIYREKTYKDKEVKRTIHNIKYTSTLFYNFKIYLKSNIN